MRRNAQRIVLAHAASAGFCYNELWQAHEEREDGSVLPSAQFAWDQPHIDASVLRWRDADGQGANRLEEVIHFCQDANWNVTALVADGTGVAVERYSYAAYGPPTFYGGDWSARGESEFACEALYCSYRYDPETGLYQVRFRYLHPTLGRWTACDPSRYADSMSFYQYAMSSPASVADPSGRLSIAFTGPGLQAGVLTPTVAPTSGDPQLNDTFGAYCEIYIRELPFRRFLCGAGGGGEERCEGGGNSA